MASSTRGGLLTGDAASLRDESAIGSGDASGLRRHPRGVVRQFLLHQANGFGEADLLLGGPQRPTSRRPARLISRPASDSWHTSSMVSVPGTGLVSSRGAAAAISLLVPQGNQVADTAEEG